MPKNKNKAELKKQYQESLRIEQAISSKQKVLEVLASIFVTVLFGCISLYQYAGYTDITEAKTMALWVMSGLLLLPFIAVLIMYKCGQRKIPTNLKELINSLSLADYGALAYLLICLISALVSPYQDIVWIGAPARHDGFITQVCYVSIYFIVSRYYRFRDWHCVFMACVMGFVAIVGIFQFYGLDILGLYPEGYHFFNSSFISLIGNINIVSTVSSLLFIFFALLYTKSEYKHKWLYFVAAILMFYLQSLAGSDSGWVAIGGGLLLSIPFVFVNRTSIQRYGWVVFAIGVAGFLSEYIFTTFMLGSVEFAANHPTTLNNYWLLVAGAGLLIFLVAYFAKFKVERKRAMILTCVTILLVMVLGVVGVEIVGARQTEGTIYQAREMLHGNLNDEFMTYRGYIWKSTAGLVKEYPLLGSGPDTLWELHQKIYGNQSVEVMNVAVDKAHNEYLQYAVCVGLLGLLAYLVWLLGVIVKWIKKNYTFESTHHNIAKFAAGGAVIAYAVQAVFNFSVPISAPFFFIILGIAASKKE